MVSSSSGSSIRLRQGLERGSEVPQRRHEVAPAGRDVSQRPHEVARVFVAGSDVIRTTRLSRSHIRCSELESRSGSDVSQRPREVARVSVAGSDVIRATRLSHSHIRCPELGSDHVRSLAFLSLGATDHVRSLVFSVAGSDVTQRPREVARVYCNTERPIRATTPGRFRAGPGTMVKKTKGKSDAERQEPESQESSLRGKALASERAGGSSIRSRQGLERGSEVPQRRHEVAPAGSNVIRATGPSRSHIQCPELKSRSGSDVLQRPREVALVSIAGSDVIRATRLSRSRFMSPRLQNRPRSDVPQRPREVAHVFCRWERRDAATT
ncbi:hypothetical protein F2Q69_00016731 [Brassica cretica]|uniref:Uncharacterized protein n=1 Tax=Brassica cretica TaxID=69181 RepID=A0A8S9R0N6_BRACR|nr:hypothetical protein F2Q69_00016731 [Brassica cretica]